MVTNNTLLLIVSLVGLALPVLSARISNLHWDAAITGLITGLLAAVAGFVGEWVNAGASFDWRHGALAALGAWASGVLITQRGVLSGTQTEAKLLAAGSSSNEPGEDPTVGLDYDEPEPTDPDPAASAVAPVEAAPAA